MSILPVWSWKQISQTVKVESVQSIKDQAGQKLWFGDSFQESWMHFVCRWFRGKKRETSAYYVIVLISLVEQL